MSLRTKVLPALLLATAPAWAQSSVTDIPAVPPLVDNAANDALSLQKKLTTRSIEEVAQLDAFRASPQAQVLFAKGAHGAAAKESLAALATLLRNHASTLTAYISCAEAAADQHAMGRCLAEYRTAAQPLAQQLSTAVADSAVRVADTQVPGDGLAANLAFLARAHPEYVRVFTEANVKASTRVFQLIVLDARYQALLSATKANPGLLANPAISAVLAGVTAHRAAITDVLNPAARAKHCLLRASRQQEFGACEAGYAVEATKVAKAHTGAKATLLEAVKALSLEERQTLEAVDQKIGAFWLLALIQQAIP